MIGSPLMWSKNPVSVRSGNPIFCQSGTFYQLCRRSVGWATKSRDNARCFDHEDPKETVRMGHRVLDRDGARLPNLLFGDDRVLNGQNTSRCRVISWPILHFSCTVDKRYRIGRKSGFLIGHSPDSWTTSTGSQSCFKPPAFAYR